MKHLSALFVTFVVVTAFTACGGDDVTPEPPAPLPYPVSGAWHGTATPTGDGLPAVDVAFTVSVTGTEVALEYRQGAGDPVLYTGTLVGTALSVTRPATGTGESRIEGVFESASSFSGTLLEPAAGDGVAEAVLELSSGAPEPEPEPEPEPSFDLALPQDAVNVDLDGATSVVVGIKNQQNVSGEPTLTLTGAVSATVPGLQWDVVTLENGAGFELTFGAPSSTASPGSYAFDVQVSFGGETPVSRAAPLTVNVNPPPLAPLSWAGGEAAPAPLYEAQGATVGDELFVFGGFYSQNIEASAHVFAYSPAENTWTQRSDMPEKLTHAGTAVDDERVFIVGGFVGNHPGPSTNSVWIYNTADDTWQPGPPLPEKRGGGALVKLGRTLHFFGGTLRVDGRYLEDSGDHWTLDLDDPVGWLAAPPLPNPRNHTAGVALGGKIYAVGGQHLGDEEAGNQTSVNVFDPALQTWTEAAPLPEPLSHTSASTLAWRGRIIVVGGVTQKSREVPTVLAYDPAADAWEELTPLPAARQSPIAGFVNNRLVVTTGSANTTQPQSDTWLSQ